MKTYSIQSFLTEYGSGLEIPLFQRKYEWKMDELQDFVNDLESVGEGFHFFGFPVLQEEKDDSEHKYYIIDGQQRIVTVYLFLCNLLDALRTCNKKYSTLLKYHDAYIPEEDNKTDIQVAYQVGIVLESSLKDILYTKQDSKNIVNLRYQVDILTDKFVFETLLNYYDINSIGKPQKDRFEAKLTSVDNKNIRSKAKLDYLLDKETIREICKNRYPQMTLTDPLINSEKSKIKENRVYVNYELISNYLRKEIKEVKNSVKIEIKNRILGIMKQNVTHYNLQTQKEYNEIVSSNSSDEDKSNDIYNLLFNSKDALVGIPGNPIEEIDHLIIHTDYLSYIRITTCLNDIANTLLTKFVVYPFFSRSIEDAFQTFDSLNNRGKSVSNNDLIKNKFLLAGAQTDEGLQLEKLKKISDYWNEVFSIKLKEQKNNDYLRVYYMSKYGHITKADLFKGYNKNISESNYEAELTEIGECADVYVSFDNKLKAPINPVEFKYYIQILRSLKSTQWKTLAMAVLRSSEKLKIVDDAERTEINKVMFDILDSLHKTSLNLIILEKRGNIVEKEIPKLAQLMTVKTNTFISGIEDGLAKINKEFKDILSASDQSKSLSVQNEKEEKIKSIKQGLFNAYMIDIDEIFNAVSKLLTTIEEEYNELQFPENDTPTMIIKALYYQSQSGSNTVEDLVDGITLEHVLPRKAQDEFWPIINGMSDEVKDRYVFSIGNMILLNKKHNSTVSRRPFATKTISTPNGDEIVEGKKETYNSSKPIDPIQCLADVEADDSKKDLLTALTIEKLDDFTLQNIEDREKYILQWLKDQYTP